MNVFMGVPSLDTEIIFRDRMIFAGRGADNPAINHMQVQAATAAAVTAYRHHITHAPAPILSSVSAYRL
jgi:hypothetical protein